MKRRGFLQVASGGVVTALVGVSAAEEPVRSSPRVILGLEKRGQARFFQTTEKAPSNSRRHREPVPVFRSGLTFSRLSSPTGW